MSFWSKFIETIGGENHSQEEVSNDASRYAFVDVEVGLKDKRIHTTSEYCDGTEQSIIRLTKGLLYLSLRMSISYVVTTSYIMI